MGTKEKRSGDSEARAAERAGEWLNEQETRGRPGTIPATDTSALDAVMPDGVRLSPAIEWVSPEELRPNSRNDFDALVSEEYAHLKRDIEKNGVLDALTVRRDGTIVTGENRWRIATELLAGGSARVKRIPVRYYVGDLSPEQEYDILEGDNLFRRHLTPKQKKERIKARIRRHFGEEIEKDRRGGDRKSENSGSKDHGDPLKEPANGSKDEGHPLNTTGGSLAEKIAKRERLPLGTAKNYLTELRKEKPAQKPPTTKAGRSRSKPGELLPKERRKGEKLAARLRTLRGVTTLLEEKLAKARAEEKKVLKELKGIGQPELFGLER